jgi:outer membrane protein
MIGKKISFIILTALLFGIEGLQKSANSQDLLTLQEAVKIGLEENYGVRISRNLREQAANNYSLGNAGFLPSLDLSASRNESVEDSEFESAAGDSQTNTGARSSSTSASLNLNWTLFDGMQMFTAYDRLGRLQDVSDKEVRLRMEDLVADIAFAYYNIIRISEQINVLEDNIAVSRERIDIEEAKLEVGSGSQYELLQAQSDLNADRAALLREMNSLTEAKIVLNEFLARDPGTDFDVEREITINRFLSREELQNRLMADNAELAIARMQNDISRLELREIRGERFPEISLSSGYSYSRSRNDGGFFRFNETTGFSVGITARVNIFNGFDTNRRVQNAQINRKNAELSLEASKLRLESDFLSIFRTYQNSLELVDLEQENLRNAEETLDIALERFRLGTISSLEFREAQRTLIAAENRLINAQFDAKIAETELLRLSGEIGSIVQL